jgi:2-polyprenyl-6-methoxyphenol hydroxylase-like FAD-dependent oxidoreductase
MKVIIIGAGIGGLIAAMSLQARGIEVEVFEAVPELRPLGVGINVLSHAIAVLDALGLAQTVQDAGVLTHELRFVNRHGQTLWSDPRGLAAGASHPQVSIHRGRLQMLLFAAAQARLGGDRIRCGARLTGFDEVGSGVRARFEGPDGATFEAEADLLIGADGIHSTVRRAFYPTEGAPKWNGILMARGLAEAPAMLDGATMIQAGHSGRKFTAYAITKPDAAGKVLINWIADIRAPEGAALPKEQWNRPANLADYLPHFEGWRFDWLDVPGLMRASAGVYEFPMVDRDPLPRWSFGRVSLLGDAAHPMSPVGSNGSTQAALDAQALADALARASDPVAGLAAYDAARREQVAGLLALNRRAGMERILDYAEQRAPEGFADVEQVLPLAERQDIVREYKTAAGYLAAAPLPQSSAEP